jgi:tetratricopeptide (TPR) repeat protein
VAKIAAVVAEYSLGEAARIFDLSPARLRYWHRTALVPALEDATEPRFGWRELVCIRAVMALLEHGVPLRRIRRSIERVRENLPEVERPLDSLRVWVEGSDRIVFRHEGALLEPDGQLVLDLAPSRDEDAQPLKRPDKVADAGSDPLSALEWFERGCRLDAGRATQGEAIEAYQRALECDPELADAHCNLGAIHHQRGDREAARRSYEAALEVEAEHVEARFNLAALHEEEGRNEAALRQYKTAVTIDPTYADVQLNLALLYEKLGLPRKARQHWRRYLGLRPAGNWADVARQRLGEESAGPPGA